MVGLGTDAASSNNCISLFNEMKLTALFNKIMTRRPDVMPAWTVLRMATIEGARAIGLGDSIGSLETGKEADMALVDLRKLNLSPVVVGPIRNIVPNLVYSATGHEVDTVIVAGQVIMQGREILTACEASIRVAAQAAADDLSRSVLQDPQHRGLALLDAMEKGLL
jgi:5-methylthioadenosine/S-adenosylhomocysteine deaminase